MRAVNAENGVNTNPGAAIGTGFGGFADRLTIRGRIFLVPLGKVIFAEKLFSALFYFIIMAHFFNCRVSVYLLPGFFDPTEMLYEVVSNASKS
jgi:hypothetical protein